MCICYKSLFALMKDVFLILSRVMQLIKLVYLLHAIQLDYYLLGFVFTVQAFVVVNIVITFSLIIIDKSICL